MRLSVNLLAYSFDNFDGYGRYGRYLVKAMHNIGVNVVPLIFDQVRLPGWMQRLSGVDYSRLTIACMPPYMLAPVPGRQWNLTMTEGTQLPPGWGEAINLRANRVIVPCDHNAAAFESSGVKVPVSVIHGGTDTAEFPMVHREYDGEEPYTFLALADRGARKGWVEVWSAFYRAFGTPADTPDARLLIKTRNDPNNPNDLIERIQDGCIDPRVSFWREDVSTMADVFSLVDCFAIPSRSEGWGMPQREAAMMGLPVIVTKNSGIDDGHTSEWAIVVREQRRERIPATFPHCGGYWHKADVDALADSLRWCYENRNDAARRGRHAARWLRENQTWEHSATQLKELIERYGNGANC